MKRVGAFIFQWNFVVATSTTKQHGSFICVKLLMVEFLLCSKVTGSHLTVSVYVCRHHYDKFWLLKIVLGGEKVAASLGSHFVAFTSMKNPCHINYQYIIKLFVSKKNKLRSGSTAFHLRIFFLAFLPGLLVAFSILINYNRLVFCVVPAHWEIFTIKKMLNQNKTSFSNFVATFFPISTKI